jgi:nicotianamine synthase
MRRILQGCANYRTVGAYKYARIIASFTCDCRGIVFGEQNMSLSTATSSVRDRLVHFEHVISRLDSLEPCPAVDHIFKELCEFCCSNPISPFVFEHLLHTDLVLKASCTNLNRLLSRYEYHLEKSWAMILGSGEQSMLLDSFLDIDDYRRSVQLEMNVLQDLGIRFTSNSVDELNVITSLVSKIVFIGSGPLPVSSMLILSEYAPCVDIYNIDRNHEANQLASIVCQRLLPAHLSTRMHFITHDIGERPFPSELNLILKESELVFVAALVGENPVTKLDILRSIVEDSNGDSKERKLAHIVIRTTDGLQQVLYPKLSVEAIATLQSSVTNDLGTLPKNVLQIESICHPGTGTRMTVIIARRL